MGQYHYVVNLDKKEYLHPHLMSCGLKLWEQLANHPGTSAALVVLLGASNGYGSGDLSTEGHPEWTQVIGRWAGDRLAIIGDYAEPTDLPPEFEADSIYGRCIHPSDRVMVKGPDGIDHPCYRDADDKLVPWDSTVYLEISDLVKPILAHHLGGSYTSERWGGSGWTDQRTTDWEAREKKVVELEAELAQYRGSPKKVSSGS